MRLLAFYSFSILFFIILTFQAFSQNKKEISNTDFVKAKQSIVNSEKRYDEARKKVYRAKEKLRNYKDSKKMNFNELQKKEGTLKQAEQKLNKMAQLIQHNKILLEQLKTNPTFGKSVKVKPKPKNKSQQKTIEDKILDERRKNKNKSKEQLKKAIEKRKKEKNNN